MFSVMGEGHIKIQDVTLFVRKVKVHPSVQLSYIKGLEIMRAQYPVCLGETEVFPIPRGNMMANQGNFFLNNYPNV